MIFNSLCILVLPCSSHVGDFNGLNTNWLLQEKPDHYDKLFGEMALDMRARPSDRTKALEEVAQEEKERLEQLEVHYFLCLSKRKKLTYSYIFTVLVPHVYTVINKPKRIICSHCSCILLNCMKQHSMELYSHPSDIYITPI